MRCLVCDGEAFEPDGEAGGVSYLICVGCGLQVMYPRVNGVDFYRDEFWSEGHKASREKRLERSLKKAGYHAAAIGRYVKSGRVLDIGCGFGHTGMLLREAGLTVDGIEPGREAADIARQNGVDIVSDTIEDFLAGSPAPTYDGISFASSLINLDDPVAALRGVRAWLKPDGILYVQVNNPIYRKGMSAYHPFIFHPQCLATALHRTGYRIVESDYQEPDAPEPFKWWLVYIARPGPVRSERPPFDLARFRATRDAGNARLAAVYKASKRALALRYPLL
jgi:SAM-dependent methyltransferase